MAHAARVRQLEEEHQQRQRLIKMAHAARVRQLGNTNKGRAIKDVGNEIHI